MELKNKVALVTGGSRGIGKAICLTLAKEGVKIAANYYRHPQNADEVVDEITSLGGEAYSIQGDVSSSDEVEKMVDKVHEEYGTIDILVNNAGHIEGGPLLKTSEASWGRIMDVHLRGPFLCCKKVVPCMIENGSGRIINIGSTGGFLGGANLPYCTAKGGLVAFTRSLARDMSRHNILVNCVAPGPTITDLGSSEPLTEEEKEKKRQNVLKKDIFPLGRAGKPVDIAKTVCFLASHDYITGEILYVSGGCQTLLHKLMM